MKTILTTLLLVFSFPFLQAQGGGSNNADASFWDGLAGSLDKYVNKFEMSPEAREALRWMSIYNTDIRMWMDGEHGDARSGQNPFGSKPAGGSIYAEFDWDNLAEKMIVDGGKESEVESYTAYTDRHGNFIVPYESTYLRMNPKKAILDNRLEILGAAFDLALLVDLLYPYVADAHSLLVAAILDLGMGAGPLATEIIVLLNMLNELGMAYPSKEAFIEGTVSPEKVKELLDQLAQEKVTSTVGFPVFIHWALMYSPDLLKAHFPVTDSKVECPDGSGPNCTQSTVSRGPEKGKSMTFDSFGRLVYINAKKEGRVRYAYDRDLTVNIPRSITFQQLLSAHGGK